MQIVSLDSFKNWLKKSIEPLCDADPTALAKYIIALLQKNSSESELRSTCIEQLEAFLGSKTEDFVSSMFSAIDSRSYISPTDEVADIDLLTEDKPIFHNSFSSDSKDKADFETDGSDISRERSPSGYEIKKSSVPYRVKFPHKHCFEFKSRGYCSRKDRCPYSHVSTNNSGLNSLKIGNLPLIPTSDVLQNILKNDVFNQMFLQNQLAFNLATEKADDLDKGKNRRMNLSHVHRAGQVSKALLLKKVPRSLASVNIAHEYFSRFGTVTNVQLNFDNDPTSIMIEFSDPNEAKSAHDCSDAVFGNRFIRVYYYSPKQRESNNNPLSFSDVSYVSPDFIAREEENKRLMQEKHSEFEEKRLNLLKEIEEETRQILLQLKSQALGDSEKLRLQDVLKTLMADKDRLLQFQVEPVSRMPKTRAADSTKLDLRPVALYITLNKFSNPADILADLSKYGKIAYSKIDDCHLTVGFSTHFSAFKAYKEASQTLASRTQSVEWLNNSPQEENRQHIDSDK